MVLEATAALCTHAVAGTVWWCWTGWHRGQCRARLFCLQNMPQIHPVPPLYPSIPGQASPSFPAPFGPPCPTPAPPLTLPSALRGRPELSTPCIEPSCGLLLDLE